MKQKVFGFFIASCSTRTTIATIVGILVFLAGYFIALSVDYETKDKSLVSFLSLHPVIAMSYGLDIIGNLEDNGVGLTSDTYSYSDTPSGYSFSNTTSNLVVSALVWGVLTWYCNRVVKGDYGRAYPLYFPFTKAYWCPRDGEAFASLGTPSDPDQAEEPMSASVLKESVSNALREQERDGRCVLIRHLVKEFGTTTAVDDVCMCMYQGHVTALLGHNGAGKSTIINMLTGTLAPTRGTASVAGYDITYEMNKVRKKIGICPQDNCLFPRLTVQEHIEFFSGIKGMYENKTREEANEKVQSAIEDVALIEKCNTFSKNLSGGMKRKLSVAIAFCGDPSVVFLDEPTSGMDPFSRRFTWNVIRQYRQDKCIILTTHFMDEADILGDRIAIMAEGNIRCVGTSLFLKKAYGVGYQLTVDGVQKTRMVHEKPSTLSREMVDHDSKIQKDGSAAVIDAVLSSVEEAKILSNVGTTISFQLPLESCNLFVKMFGELDKLVEHGTAETYGVSITTLDEVFLMVARGEFARHRESSARFSIPSTKRILEDAESESESVASDTVIDTAEPLGPITSAPKIELESDRFHRHVQALFQKRAKNFKRDRRAWFCSVALPTLLALVGFIIVKFVVPSREMDPLALTLADNNKDVIENKNPIPFNEIGIYTCNPGRCIMPTSQEFDISMTEEHYYFCGVSATFGDQPVCTINSSNAILDQAEEAGAFPVPHNVSSLYESSQSLFQSSQSFAASQYGALYFTHEKTSEVQGDAFTYSERAIAACKNRTDTYRNEDETCDGFSGIGYIVSTNFTSLHASLLYQAVADEAIIKFARQDDDFSISATIHPLPITALEESYAAGDDTFMAWFVVIFSFPFIAGTFATFVVQEKMLKAKHLQTVAGVKPTAYWVSSFLWDMLNYQLPLWIVVMLIYAIDIDPYTTTKRGAAGGVIVTLLLYGPAAAGFTYCITFLFESPNKCNFFVILINFFIGFAGTFVTYILYMIGKWSDPDKDNLINISIALQWILRFMPAYNLSKPLWAILNVNEYERFAGHSLSVWSSDILLIETIFQAVESVVYLILAIQLDKWSTKPNIVRKWTRFLEVVTFKPLRKMCLATSAEVTPCDGPINAAKDEDVAIEENRVIFDATIDDSVVVKNLTKRYPNGKLAVDDVSFGLPPGECFGLLGTNGAGKTTLMGILTAEFPPTDGDAFMGGFSILRQPDKTRRLVGYCPQFDAHFMNLTGTEHLELYASIRGIPREDIKDACARKLAEIGLSAKDGNRLSSGYSGGMKRKLSVACATIGQPPIVLLDEPSTGMDPVARRDLWRAITDMVVGFKRRDIDGRIPAANTSVLLITHSMEECEALCPRIGIMAGGTLRCLGSAQHLKSRFGRGFQVELKVKSVLPGDDDAQATMLDLLARTGLGASLPPQEREFLNEGRDIENPVASQTELDADGPNQQRPSLSARERSSLHLDIAERRCMRLGEARAAAYALTRDESLSSMISPDHPIGYVIYKSASSGEGIAVSELAAFCTAELRIRSLCKFVEERYPDAVMRERQDNKVRYEVGREGNRKVSSLFKDIEENKERLMLADYGVSQTTLEQVFNTFAAEAEKEKYNVVDAEYAA